MDNRNRRVMKPSGWMAFLVSALAFAMAMPTSAEAKSLGTGPSKSIDQSQLQHSGGASKNFIPPNLMRAVRQANTPTSTGPGKIYTGSKKIVAGQSSFNQGSCGSGDYVRNRSGAIVATVPGTSVTHANCPPPGTHNSVPVSSPPAATITHWISQGPLYFNGCQTNPLQSVVTNDWSSTGVGFWDMRLASGEPGGVVVQPPQSQTLVMGATTEPKLQPGQQIPASGMLAPAPSLWGSMQTEGAIGQVIPGPMWAVWSQKMFPETTTQFYIWRNGQWIPGPSSTVTGPPVWRAGESYNVNSCPAPIVNITPTSTLP